MPIHHHALNGGFDVPCLDGYFSRPFKVYTVNLRFRNMRLRVFVCVSRPIHDCDVPQVDFVIFKRGTTEHDLVGIHFRDLDTVRDSAQRYVVYTLVLPNHLSDVG